jgi:CubicO group peptidase (beta-lactamase class C family)
MTLNRAALLVLSALALAGCATAGTYPSPGAAVASRPAARPIVSGATPAQVAAVDSLMSRFTAETPGAVVGVVRGGELVFAKGYGMADLEHGVPFDVATVTNIGSTAKQFTALGILLLAERGQLSLDDDIQSHIPELPDFGQTVRLRHLLTHTSGYREFINLLMLAGRQVMEGDHVARPEIIGVVQRQPRLQNEPGAEFNYNNTGYGLLAMVVERVTGSDFDAWMAREVFEPLGMADTRVRLHDGQLIPRRAAGYVGAPGSYRAVRDLGAAAGAGGVYTTVADLARWMRNLGTTGLGGTDAIRAMTTPNVLPGGQDTGYGLGLMMDTDRGLRRWQHGGGDIAHRSHFFYYPDLDAGYMVLSNDAAMPADVVAQIGRVFFGEQMTAAPDDRAAQAAETPPHLVAGETLERYVGRYALDPMPAFVLAFTREGDRLYGQGTGQPRFELRALSDTSFAIVGVPARVTFHVAEDGRVPRLTLHQNGDHGATRLVEQAPDPAPFAGRYFSRELETFYTLAVENGALTVRHRRFGPITLTHARGDRYTGTLPFMQVDFERDATGRVTGFRADAGGRARDVLFERVD